MKIVIGADLVPTPQSEPLFIAGDADKLFTDVLPIMQNADETIVNLECALTYSDVPLKKLGPNLKASPKCADVLKKAGVTAVTLSNNHVYDFGTVGLLDTVKALDEAGIPYMGIGENDTDSRKLYFIEREGKKIAIVNVCEHEYTYATADRIGANPFDPFITMQDIREAKKQADFVIVIYHGGKEYCRYPSPRLINLCHEMALCGASVVVTQHSHCIGCYEEYEGCHILYGQGNFHFSKAYDGEADVWDTCLLMELDVKDDIKVKFYPITLDEKSNSISLAKGKRADEIMEPFYARNKQLLNGEWEKGWHDFCVSMTELYERVAKGWGKQDTERTRQMFCHFLDCEAHTDVWRELYKTWNHTNKE
ncbi:MAG: CapA family protein [Clostridia bacterium]|nr:CapA family protein [Clostridia bacterium]